jgi:type IV secretory pathway VirB10-like protein
MRHKTRKRHYLLIVAVVIVGAIASACSCAGREPAATPTDTAEAATETPTPTQKPTATPEPTDTPRPTSTPKPTDTPETSPQTPEAGAPEISVEEALEAAYLSEVIEVGEALAQASEALSGHLAEAGQDLSLIADENWQSGVLADATAIQAVAAQIDEMEVPSRFQDLHGSLGDAAGHSAAAADLVTNFLDTNNLASLGQAVAESALAAAAAAQAAIEAATLE